MGLKILAMSDQHGLLPIVPPCDLLLVAGDLCPDRFDGIPAHSHPERQLRWLQTTWYGWRSSQPATRVIATFGNHDFCAEPWRNPVNRFDADTVFVKDAQVEYRGLKIYATPWSVPFMHWAFMKTERELEPIYARIPEGLDILLTHSPPHGHVDVTGHVLFEGEAHVGSVALRRAIERAKPKVVICGHIHSGFGQSQIGDTMVYNVALLDESRRGLVRRPTEIPYEHFQVRPASEPDTHILRTMR